VCISIYFSAETQPCAGISLHSSNIAPVIKSRVSPRKIAKPGGRAARSPPCFCKKKRILKVDRNLEIMTIVLL